ncbi:MAG: hypothetical protein MAG794_01752 [Gammaproteobacteria bacterium]|nr:hypothetical protein [Gammaproteobacteria bacterium]
MRWCLLAVLLPAALNAGADCRQTTAALDSMSGAELILAGPEKESIKLAVRVADDYRERAGGFQYVCPETIQSTAIYFLFERSRHANFHMRNVKAPLDIAFIDESGSIVDIQRMEPAVLGTARHRYYSPRRPVAAALETRAGYFIEQRITVEQWKIERLQ